MRWCCSFGGASDGDDDVKLDRLFWFSELYDVVAAALRRYYFGTSSAAQHDDTQRRLV